MKGKKIMAFGEETCSDVVQIHDLSWCLAQRGVYIRMYVGVCKEPKK